MDALVRNHVKLQGRPDARTMVFAHGFGCDQNMWRRVAPAFEEDHRVVLFDHVGAGRSDVSQYSKTRYGTLDAYADDIVGIGNALQLEDAVLVGHSVSAMIGIIAAIASPGMFGALVLVGPSPCYINDGDYQGGFSRAEIEDLLELLDTNHMGWSMAMAPAIMGNADRPELTNELAESFCRMDPEIAKQFARVTFLSDTRSILDKVDLPTLVLQCSDDVIAPLTVGEYTHARLSRSKLVIMKAKGHCPNLSAPEETIAAIRAFL